MDGRIFNLKEKLLNNLKHNWSIEEMAKIVGLSTSHFQRLFKSNTGITPATYLRDLRLEKARQLLETTFRNISEIRDETGMRHDNHFTHDFKKKFGVTPTEYRKQYWEKSEP
jgi:AraC family transcriptional regulator, activator of mtrCDE